MAVRLKLTPEQAARVCGGAIAGSDIKFVRDDTKGSARSVAKIAGEVQIDARGNVSMWFTTAPVYHLAELATALREAEVALQRDDKDAARTFVDDGLATFSTLMESVENCR